MRYESIADVFSANNAFREQFRATLAGISPDEAIACPEDEKWSIQQIAEHVSMVDTGITMICGKLLESVKATDKRTDDGPPITENFVRNAMDSVGQKLEAPDRVQPTGNTTIEQSIEVMAKARAAFDAMRSDLEAFDLAGAAFPHPYFGDLNAGEWLVLSGLHQNRHNRQIETLLEKIRQ